MAEKIWIYFHNCGTPDEAIPKNFESEVGEILKNVPEQDMLFIVKGFQYVVSYCRKKEKDIESEDLLWNTAEGFFPKSDVLFHYDPSKIDKPYDVYAPINWEYAIPVFL